VPTADAGGNSEPTSRGAPVGAAIIDDRVWPAVGIGAELDVDEVPDLLGVPEHAADSIVTIAPTDARASPVRRIDPSTSET
jgi:hypothetical protein